MSVSYNSDIDLYNNLIGSSIYLISINSQYSKNAFITNTSGGLSSFGTASKQVIEELKDYYADVGVIKYTIFPNRILMLLCVKGELQKNALHLLKITPFGVYTLIEQLKSIISKQTGVYIWSKSFGIKALKDKSEFISACNYMNNTEPIPLK